MLSEWLKDNISLRAQILNTPGNIYAGSQKTKPLDKYAVTPTKNTDNMQAATIDKHSDRYSLWHIMCT